MTKFQALFIKLLRVRYDYSWRAVHREWQIRYIPKEEWYYNGALVGVNQIMNEIFGLNPETPNGNQICGAKLCEDAMKYLGENNKDGWN